MFLAYVDSLVEWDIYQDHPDWVRLYRHSTGDCLTVKVDEDGKCEIRSHLAPLSPSLIAQLKEYLSLE